MSGTDKDTLHILAIRKKKIERPSVPIPYVSLLNRTHSPVLNINVI